MTTKTIKVSDLIGTTNAIIQPFGLQVFEAIKKEFEVKNEVILDFNGITNLTSGFCHASIGQAYMVFPCHAPEYLKIIGVDSSSIWNEKIKESIELAQSPDKARFLDDAISALFN